MATDDFARAVPVRVDPRMPFITKAGADPAITTVTSTPQRVFLNNPNRIEWMIENTGAVDIVVGGHSGISSSVGNRVGAGGGFYGLHVNSDGSRTIREVWAVSTGANSTIDAWQEEWAPSGKG